MLTVMCPTCKYLRGEANMEQALWSPTQAQITQTQLYQWMQDVAREKKRQFDDYHDFYRWSCDNPADFWQAWYHASGIITHQSYETVLENPHQMPGARWFVGATLNFAENCLQRNDDKIALIAHKETGERSTMTYHQLHQAVASVAASLREQDVGKGDRVAGLLPNCIETVVVMLATTSLGAIWSSCSPDFGFAGILDRFGQIDPKVLFVCDGHEYNGKKFPATDKILQLSQSLNHLTALVCVPFIQTTLDPKLETIAIGYHDFITRDPPPLTMTPVPFDHPLYIMFSSGTTGIPKCIVHGTGGTLLQHVKEHRLHCDLRDSDGFFYFTTCGWMMWQWLVSGLATGCTLVLYDGAPTFPNAARLLDIAEHEKITVFGSSAKYFSAIQKNNIIPKKTHDLSALRMVLSTGSPLLPEQFDYLYHAWKKDFCVSSISGGTDIISCFALGNPTLPVYRGELQCRGLGLAVEIFDDNGNAINNQKGELVCTKPFPCMPVGFWGDNDNKKYFSAYFNKYPNVWAHGDYALLTEHQGLVIFGRSDTVLNAGGVRIGTAEIYRQVEKIPEIVDCICCTQMWDGDSRIILFVQCAQDQTLTPTLIETIKTTLRDNASPKHIPAKIIAVPAIPRTISGKLVELAVQQVIHGKTVKNKDAIANPDALQFFENCTELKEA